MSAMQKQLSTIFPLISGCILMLLTTGTMAQSQCPQRFHTIPLTENAKFCQQFDDRLPASLSFYSAVTPQAALGFYLEQLDSAQQSESKGRQVLQSSEGDWVVVISADGDGSQIDILVKNSSEE